MVRLLALALLATGFLACRPAHAAPAASETAIRTVLDRQVTSWNRGDIVSFMDGYKRADDTTFVAKTVEHGFSNIFARYQKKFASKEQMGTLGFDDLAIRPLDAHYAIVTGRFHLARTASAGGDAEGVFSLIFEHTAAGHSRPHQLEHFHAMQFFAAFKRTPNHCIRASLRAK